jgi:nitrogen fixation protein FixH
MGWRGILGMAAIGVLLAAPAKAMDNMTHGHGDMKGGHGAHGGTGMEKLGDKVFSGKVGPWAGEARLVDMKAQMEKSGVSAKAVAKLPASHHLMVILTDPKTGKPVDGVAGTAEIKGPDKASSTKVTLVVMGGHIGADVNLPKAGKYTFRVNAEGGGNKGSAEFTYDLKR